MISALQLKGEEQDSEEKLLFKIYIYIFKFLFASETGAVLALIPNQNQFLGHNHPKISANSLCKFSQLWGTSRQPRFPSTAYACRHQSNQESPRLLILW